MTDVAKVALRPALPDAFEYVFGLHKEGLGDYVRGAWGWDEDARRRDVRARLDGGLFEIASANGRDIGMISTSVHADHVYLHHLIVAPECRGGGLGTALIEIVQARARARGVPLRFSVFRTNPAWALVAPVGPYLEASIVHDFLYIAWQDLDMEPRSNDWEFADNIMRAGMVDAGVDKSQIVMIYAALRGFGWPVYKKPDPPPRYVAVP